MCRVNYHLVCLALVLALGGANVALGEMWEGIVTTNQDAVEQSNPTPTGAMDFGSSDLEFMDDGGIQTIGLRFNNVQVPAGATISKAYVVVTTEETPAGGPVNMIIQAHLTPNAPEFASAPGNISTRPLTTAVAKWTADVWTVDNEPHQTADISPVISEVVNQPGWAAGNSIVLVFNQDPALPSVGHRTTHKAATQGYEPKLHIEYTLGNASNPSPPDTATEVSRDTDLRWTPGMFAASTNAHKVYFSKKLSDITANVGGVTQSATTYDPGRLEFGTKYYWRVDENNAAPKGGVNVGSIWSFTTELYSYPIAGANIIASASSTGEAAFSAANTINGSGLQNDLHSTMAEDMWLSGSEPQGAWIQYEFDKVYKLHEMWVWNSNQVFEGLFGFGLKDVIVQYSSNGTEWAVLAGVPQFTKGPGTAGYAHNTTVAFAGVAAKYVKLTATSNWGGFLPQYCLSEVRFYSIPVNPAAPSPASGATGVDVMGATLSWRAGREAGTHKVYLSSDQQSVAGGTAPVATAPTASYIPPALNMNTSYYWKVAEVNEVQTPSTWESNVWSFVTKDSIVVDDFESYNDIETTAAGSNRIYVAWADGYSDPANGSLVGKENPPFAETKIVHGGKQAMPLYYTNSAGATYSEGKRTFAVPQDWTKHGIKTLSLWFFGTSGNTGQLYVKINNSKITYTGAAGDLALTGWQTWNIDLTAPGLNLQSVSSLAIGIDGGGAAGVLYIDDIRLYPYPRQTITPVAPNAAGLVGLWTFDGNTQDTSGKNNHGTSGGSAAPAYVPGKVGANAINLRGADYIVIDGVDNDVTSTNLTLSVWIKTTQTTEGEIFATNDAQSAHPLMLAISGGSPSVNDGGDHTFPPAVNDDQWHLLTFVRSGNTGYVYVDGLLRGMYASSFSLATVTRWSIGQEWDNATASNFYTGAVDDARIYNNALSSSEVGWLAGRTQPFDQPF